MGVFDISIGLRVQIVGGDTGAVLARLGVHPVESLVCSRGRILIKRGVERVGSIAPGDLVVDREPRVHRHSKTDLFISLGQE